MHTTRTPRDALNTIPPAVLPGTGAQPMSDIHHSELHRNITQAPASDAFSQPSRPLVPNRPGHTSNTQSQWRLPSTPSSNRYTIASATVPASEDDGYTSDATTSTVPPSYKTHRSHPDLPDYSWTADLAPPLPTASTSNTEYVTAPPSAYVQPGRRRRRRHPRAGGIARGLAHSEESKATESLLDQQGRSNATQLADVELQEYPRKSVDGGVRLAGGPLHEAE